MEENFNAEAVKDFNEGEGSTESRTDIKMLLDALLSDNSAMEQLAAALQPYLAPAEVPEEEEVPVEGEEEIPE